MINRDWLDYLDYVAGAAVPSRPIRKEIVSSMHNNTLNNDDRVCVTSWLVEESRFFAWCCLSIHNREAPILTCCVAMCENI